MTPSLTREDYCPPKAEKERPWLPGPPPRRRKTSISAVLHAYEVENIIPLYLPIRKMSLESDSGRNHSSVRSYLHQLPFSGDQSGSLRGRFLFHGCAYEKGSAQETLSSFSMIGPSIRFSRPHSYFSRKPAVYWTDSFTFALAWCVFTETGSWKPQSSLRDSDTEYIIFVSKIDDDAIIHPSRTYLIPVPTSVNEEQGLVDWCVSNMDATKSSERTPPPGTARADWSMIGSRIPKHTMISLSNALSAFSFDGLERSADSVWLFATCNEESSRMMAKSGIEVLRVGVDNNMILAKL